MQVYLVGGAVRDALLGLPVHERDWVVVGATPEQMTELGYVPADPRFPVFRHPETGDEYALARREVKDAPGHKGFRVDTSPDVTLAEDLQRRDLRVNAIARTPDGALVDPFAGCEDIDARRLHHVTDAFVEDPLRLLRAARFAATLAPLGFALTAETMALMRVIAHSGELELLSAERIWRETARALSSDSPATYLEVLEDCGALERLLQGVDPPPDVRAGIAALANATSATDDPASRLAVLATAMAPDQADQAAAGLGGTGEVGPLCNLLRAMRTRLTGPEEATADGLMCTLEALDALRRPDRLSRVIGAYRLLAARQTPDPVERLLAAHQVAASVRAQEIVAEGISGKAVGDALRERRVTAIAGALGLPRETTGT